MDDTPEFLIFVTREKLSDGSEVFNVVLGDIKLSAISESDAQDMAEKIADAINDHTNSTADTVFE